MNNDLISRSALKIIIEQSQLVNAKLSIYNVLKIIDNAPTVPNEYMRGYEAAEREYKKPTGKWIKHIDNLYPEDSTEECPFCHEEQRLVGNDDNFCPYCGAKMQKGEEK